MSSGRGQYPLVRTPARRVDAMNRPRPLLVCRLRFAHFVSVKSYALTLVHRQAGRIAQMTRNRWALRHLHGRQGRPRESHQDARPKSWHRRSGSTPLLPDPPTRRCSPRSSPRLLCENGKSTSRCGAWHARRKSPAPRYSWRATRRASSAARS